MIPGGLVRTCASILDLRGLVGLLFLYIHYTLSAYMQFTADWQTRISVALQRGNNAYALMHRAKRDRARAGRQCRERGHMHDDMYDL